MTSSSSQRAFGEKLVPHTRVTDTSRINDTYIVGKKLGEGSFGKVYEGIHRETDEKWAIKSINKEKAGTMGLKLMEREVYILKRVKHPNIIELNEVIESPQHMFLVLELCEGGELADALKVKNHYDESSVKTIMKQLSSAISYLHKNDIVHRDIKLENILLCGCTEDIDSLVIKVTDFGLSVVKGGQGHDNMMQDFCGTPMYMAPEIIENKTYSQQCDVWAMGVICYILLCGSPPFPAVDDETLVGCIKKGDIDFSFKEWKPVSTEAQKCIQGMLTVDPAHRLSAAEVLDQPWFTGEARDDSAPRNVLEMMKTWGPELRRSEAGLDSSSSDESSAINGEMSTILSIGSAEHTDMPDSVPESEMHQESNVSLKVDQLQTSSASKSDVRDGSGHKRQKPRENRKSSTSPKSDLESGPSQRASGVIPIPNENRAHSSSTSKLMGFRSKTSTTSLKPSPSASKSISSTRMHSSLKNTASKKK
ncbi:serine/threonine-protein kinase 33-like [Gigantopelta aegis]|uniref:serine/threonine-protein kinase 33-like n=1 Tax=Gigantopelta aegis TaxID=1735272 RepID=UPI001B88CEC0|nr:serine/threonine-protein kinase 33-like [Gigantopelta aegis]XP_041354064.1 serine/threonine-protein kinase 33-like [Gigantopelta aegis]